MLRTNTLKKKNGFSLLSVLVAASLLGGLSMVMMQMGKQSTKSTAKLTFDTEVNQITNEINGILSDPTSCKSTLIQSSITSILKNIPNTPTPLIKYDITKGPYGNGSVKIASYLLNLTGTGPDIPNLQIIFKNKEILTNQSKSNALITRTIKLDVTPANVTTVGVMTNCRSVSTATDTMWNRQSDVLMNIYYNSGNVGIGTTSSSTNLDVAHGINAGHLSINANGVESDYPVGNYWALQQTNGANDFNISRNGFNGILTIQRSTGNVGIGMTSPNGKLQISVNNASTIPPVSGNTVTDDFGALALRLINTNTTAKNWTGLSFDYVSGGTAAVIAAQNILNGTADLAFATRTIATGLSEKMRITSSGNIGIGTVSPTKALDVNGDITSSSATGTISSYSFQYTSDRKLKKNITTIDDSLERILGLRGVHFDWKATNKHDVGFIAQEVKKQIPEIVKYDSARDIQTVDYAKVVPFLVEAIKAQQTEINLLKKNIRELQNIE